MKTRRLLVMCLAAGSMAGAFFAGAWAQEKADANGQHNPIWRWPDTLEAVNAAPKNHKILFENDHVRLLEVVVQPGETENMHGHKYPSVFMMDAPQPKIINKNLEEANGGGPGNDQPPPPRRTVFDGKYPTCRAMSTLQAPHQVTNVDTFPQHFYRMEFKKIDGDSIKSMTKYPPEQK